MVTVAMGLPHEASAQRPDRRFRSRRGDDRIICSSSATAKIGFIKRPSQHNRQLGAVSRLCRGAGGTWARPGRRAGRAGLFHLSARAWSRPSACSLARSRPTAIFASNDDMAAAAVNVAHRAGLARSGGHQRRRLRRHRAGDDGLAGADHGQAADRGDGARRRIELLMSICVAPCPDDPEAEIERVLEPSADRPRIRRPRRPEPTRRQGER